MKGRIKDDDSSVPQKDGAFVYWHAFDAGAEYRKWYRRPAAAAPTPSFSTSRRSRAGHDYFRLGGHAVSPDGRLLAYAVDTNGSERFVLKVRDLETGAELARPDRELALRPGLGRGFKELSLHRRRRELALEDRLASPARRSAIGGPRDLSRARREIRRVARPHAIARLRHSSPPAITPPTKSICSRWTTFAQRPCWSRPARPTGSTIVDEREGTLYIRVNDTHPEFPRGDGAGVAARRLDRADRRQRPPLHPVGSPPSRTCWWSRSASTACRRSGCATMRAARSAISRSRRRASSRAWRTIRSIASTGCASATSRW